jgi:hypothetical protein
VSGVKCVGTTVMFRATHFPFTCLLWNWQLSSALGWDFLWIKEVNVMVCVGISVTCSEVGNSGSFAYCGAGLLLPRFRLEHFCGP